MTTRTYGNYATPQETAHKAVELFNATRAQIATMLSAPLGTVNSWFLKPKTVKTTKKARKTTKTVTKRGRKASKV